MTSLKVLLSFHYSFNHSMKSVILSTRNSELLEDEIVREWCESSKKCHTQSIKKDTSDSSDGNVIKILTLSFNTIKQGDAAYHVLQERFKDSEEIDVYHPTNNFLFLCPHHFLSRTIVLENIPESITEEDLVEKFPEAENIFCFHEGNGRVGTVILEMTNMKDAINFKHKNKDMKIETNKIKFSRLPQSCLSEILQSKNEGISKIDDKERNLLCETIHDTRNKIQDIMNDVECFGEEKIKPCLQLFKGIEEIIRKITQDTVLRLEKYPNFPERNQILSFTLRLAYRPVKSDSEKGKIKLEEATCSVCGIKGHCLETCPIGAFEACEKCGNHNHNTIDCQTLVKNKEEALKDMDTVQARERIQKIMNARINFRLEAEKCGGEFIQNLQVEFNQRLNQRTGLGSMSHGGQETNMEQNADSIKPLLNPEDLKDTESARLKIQAVMNYRLNKRAEEMGHMPDYPNMMNSSQVPSLLGDPLAQSTQDLFDNDAGVDSSLMSSLMGDPLAQNNPDGLEDTEATRIRIQAVMNYRLNKRAQEMEQGQSTQMPGLLGYGDSGGVMAGIERRQMPSLLGDPVAYHSRNKSILGNAPILPLPGASNSRLPLDGFGASLARNAIPRVAGSIDAKLQEMTYLRQSVGMPGQEMDNFEFDDFDLEVRKRKIMMRKARLEQLVEIDKMDREMDLLESDLKFNPKVRRLMEGNEFNQAHNMNDFNQPIEKRLNKREMVMDRQNYNTQGNFGNNYDSNQPIEKRLKKREMVMDRQNYNTQGNFGNNYMQAGNRFAGDYPGQMGDLRRPMKNFQSYSGGNMQPMDAFPNNRIPPQMNNRSMAMKRNLQQPHFTDSASGFYNSPYGDY